MAQIAPGVRCWRPNWVRVFAEREGLEVLAYVYTQFRPGEVLPEEYGRGAHPYSTSWEELYVRPSGAGD